MKSLTVVLTYPDTQDTFVHARLADIGTNANAEVRIKGEYQTPSIAQFGAVDEGKKLDGWNIPEIL